MIEEIWKPIPNFTRYEASSFGNLRSLNYKNSGKTIILKPTISSDGYIKTMLLNDLGKYSSWTVHKFVALSFMGVIPENHEINHIDGNKLNNRLDNLEYVTRSENLLHAFRLGLCKPARGSINGNSKLNESQIKEIRDHAKNNKNYGRKALAIKYNISEATIKDIVTRRRNSWPHV